MIAYPTECLRSSSAALVVMSRGCLELVSFVARCQAEGKLRACTYRQNDNIVHILNSLVERGVRTQLGSTAALDRVRRIKTGDGGGDLATTENVGRHNLWT